VTAPTTPNAELAYKILDQIDAHPETWNQGTWDCGTAACFAGWAVRLSGGISDPDGYDSNVVDGPAYLIGMTVDEAAREVLGSSGWTPSTVDPDEEDWLFSAGNDRADLGRLVAEIFGPRPVMSTGTGCRCDWLGEGTPEHAPSPLCRSLRPDADRQEMQPPPCADHQVNELSCPVCSAQRRAFYAALSRDEATS
jgi:hypothetical protein